MFWGILLCLPLVLAQQEPARLVFPQIADGDGFQAEILLRNTSDKEVEGTLKLRKGLGEAFEITLNGESGSQFSFKLPPRGALRYQSGSSRELQVGYAVVESDSQGSEVTGAVVYGAGSSEVSVSSSPLAPGHGGFIHREDFEVPDAEGDERIRMGIAMANPGESPLEIHLRLIDHQGATLLVSDLTLEPGAHLARFLDEEGVFGSSLSEADLANPFQGTLQATSLDGRFAMTLLRVRLPSGRLASLGSRPIESVFAILDTTVLPMDTDEVLAGQTVIIRGEKIDRIGPAQQVAIPSQAVVIDGSGRYLLPGLADMHVHLGFRAELLLFLANGVTTVREMWGGPGHVRLRDLIEDGDVLGPSMLVAGPGFDGIPPVWPRTIVLEDPAQAEAEVEAYQAAGYDYIKIYNNLDPAPYQAVVEAAGVRGMRLIGHIPWQVGADAALEAGQYSIEHFLQLSQHVTTAPSGHWWDPYDPALGDQMAQRFAALTAWNDPTISTNVAISLTSQELNAVFNSPLIRFMPPARVESWRSGQFNQFTAAQRVPLIENMQRFLKSLHDAGARLLMGTDAGFPAVFPGYSIHDELQIYVVAGLTPLQALRIASWNAAEYAQRTDQVGAVREGLKADLILVEANPLDDIANLKRRAGVMVRGRWLPEQELQRRLEEQALSFQASRAESGGLIDRSALFVHRNY